MSKRKEQRPKNRRVPQRTCIACRETSGKREMIRIVRTQDSVVVDPTGKLAGRGAYIHPDRSCWQSALESRRIEQALRQKLSNEERQKLIDFMTELPASDSEPAEVPARHESE